MQKAVEYTLDHPRVKLLRRLFEDNQQTWGKEPYVSFEVLFDAFRIDRSFLGVSKEVGRSYNNVRRLYYRYFVKLFPAKDGFERSRRRALRRQQTNKSVRAQGDSHDPVLQTALRVAREHGCKVEQVLTPRPLGFRKKACIRRFKVNWNLCTLHLGTVTDGGRYAVVQCHQKELELYDAIVVYVPLEGAAPLFFVVPMPNFLELMFGDSKKIMRYALFPLEHPVRKGRPMNLARYKDAWHLLTWKDQTNAAA